MAMPAMAPLPGPYSVDTSFGSHCSARSGASRSAGMTEWVIEMGHITPALTWSHRNIRPARTVWAPGRGSAQGSEWMPRSMPSRSSQCQDGSSWISSTRLP